MPEPRLMGGLCFFSSLFMAMPISVLGNAMSHAWTDPRHGKPHGVHGVQGRLKIGQYQPRITVKKHDIYTL